MPTILMLDSSLSMTRPVKTVESGGNFDRRHLAISGISAFLDYLAVKCKLEFVSLIEFSATWVQSVAFTRDFEQIKAALNKPSENYLLNKTCIEAALAGISQPLVDEWGHSSCQLLLITDGSAGVGEGSLKHSVQTAASRDSTAGDAKFPLPFPFACKFHVLCLAPPGDPSSVTSPPLLEKLIEINGHGGEVFLPEGQLSTKSVQNMFTKVAENYFHPFYGTLKCGNLKCTIQLFPSPEDYEKDHDFQRVEKSMWRTIEICGFLDIVDMSSPPFTSRHLVLPVSSSVEDDLGLGKHEVKDDEDEVEAEEGKTAAFTVLLHGSLKVEGMVALTQIAEDWYGVLYSFADNKKKSNLVLSVFEPGVDVTPWLGNLNNLAPIDDFANPPYGEEDNKTPFPVRPPDRRSYAQNCVVWIRQSGLQADIQKILRNARKLPEKQQHFYKELNRLRKAALSLGFLELLVTVAQLLQRECSMLPGNAHPDAALQLGHAAGALTSEAAKDFNYMIAPMRTHFSGD